MAAPAGSSIGSNITWGPEAEEAAAADDIHVCQQQFLQAAGSADPVAEQTSVSMQASATAQADPKPMAAPVQAAGQSTASSSSIPLQQADYDGAPTTSIDQIFNRRRAGPNAAALAELPQKTGGGVIHVLDVPRHGVTGSTVYI